MKNNTMKLSCAAAAVILALSSVGCGTSGGSSETEPSSAAAVSSENTASVYVTATRDEAVSAPSRLKRPADSAADAVTVVWAKDSQAAEYDEYTVDESDYSTEVMITANEDVTNLRVISTMYSVSDMEDEPGFLIKDGYTYGKLESGKSLKLVLSFPGDIPTSGIAFTDKDGEEHFCTLSESGKDGSLVLSEIK